MALLPVFFVDFQILFCILVTITLISSVVAAFFFAAFAWFGWLRLDDFGPLTGVDGTHNVLVGCFENEDCVAYYVMNFNYRFENTAILDFGDGADFTVWGADGVESMGVAKKLEITLLPGEGKFIEMKKYN